MSERDPSAGPELAAGKCPVSHVAAYSWPSDQVTECPFPFYEALREEDPVHQLDGSNNFIVSRWEDLVRVATDVTHFSSGLFQTDDESLHRPPGQEVGAQSALVGKRLTPFPSGSSDPPEHRHKRSLGMRMLSPDRLKSYEPMIRAHVNMLIDRWIEAGACEFRTGFSDLLPVEVICDIMGQPHEVRSTLAAWSNIEAGGAARFSTPARREADVKRATDMADYMRGQILKLRGQPREGFLSELIQAQIEMDGEFDLEFLVAEAALLVFAGNVTTAHLIASAMVRLARSPELADRLRSDTELIPAFVDEMLRLESPTQWTQRICVEETEIGGVTIPKGAWVLMFWASGNRDPRRFENPEELDLEREDVAKRQLSFGFGIHRCTGAPLARLESTIAIQTLLERLSNIELDEEGSDIRNIDSVRFRVPRRILLRFQRADTAISV